MKISQKNMTMNFLKLSSSERLHTVSKPTLKHNAWENPRSSVHIYKIFEFVSKLRSELLIYQNEH
jgi:hypothetical protein